MKRLLLFFLLLSAYASQAQTIQKINVYGYQYNRLVMDSAFGLPKDTFSVPVSYRHLPHISAKDTAIYIWSPALQKWRLASAGGSGGVATAWGQLTGSMSSQTDLQTALNAKQNSLTTGTSLQYRKGDHSLGTFSTDVLAVGNPVFAPINHGHNGLIPPGGLPGQILKKKSISDWDMDWYYEDTTASAVASVNGRTGAVTAQATDYAAFYPSLTGYNKTNWDNAYSWGNHASAGYLKGVDTVSLSNRINSNFTSISQVNDSTFTLNRANGTKDTVLISFTAGSSSQVNADWNASSGVAQILNKPTIPTNNNQLTNGSNYVTNSTVALSYLQNVLATNPTLTGGSSSQILSVTLTAGTWMVTGMAEFFSPSNTAQDCRLQIWSGGTQVAEANGFTPAITSESKLVSLHASTIVTVGSSTTLHLDVLSTVASIMQSNGKATQLNAVKIAP